ncbi:uncharacterized protein MONBRDRAFT_7175 [Monosiga brevicollis MX1]|uniref:Uncharacterized protein n=1 Tax=Monosiga brevicollis TaxID=81824 RepID=A9UW60_MONBE|nr:uncharacterized protein MONBRDRAFT_7175 [Monosiga brevicollis MX1]EDQ90711.1 predicted protein [Monosiga brevicollis MX1]|eukprot:XP_001744762.1 hypothetical protein [Monosiga brevicollis MX1]
MALGSKWWKTALGVTALLVLLIRDVGGAYNANCTTNCRACSGRVFFESSAVSDCAGSEDNYPHGQLCTFECSRFTIYSKKFVCDDGAWIWPDDLGSDDICPEYHATTCTFAPHHAAGPTLNCNACQQPLALTKIDQVPYFLSGNLEHLDVACQAISAFYSMSTFTARRLRSANLSHTGVEHIESLTFRTPLDLEVLDVSQNKFDTLQPKMFPAARPSFHTLLMDGNPELGELRALPFNALFSRSCNRTYVFTFTATKLGCFCQLDPTPDDCGRITCNDACSLEAARTNVSCSDFSPEANPFPNLGSALSIPPEAFCDGVTDCANGFDEALCDIYVHDSAPTEASTYFVHSCFGSAFQFTVWRGIVVLVPDVNEPTNNFRCVYGRAYEHLQLLLRVNASGIISDVDPSMEAGSRMFHMIFYNAKKGNLRVKVIGQETLPLEVNFTVVDGYPAWLTSTTVEPSTLGRNPSSSPAATAGKAHTTNPAIIATVVSVAFVVVFLALGYIWRQRHMKQSQHASRSAWLQRQLDDVQHSLKSSSTIDVVSSYVILALLLLPSRAADGDQYLRHPCAHVMSTAV